MTGRSGFKSNLYFSPVIRCKGGGEGGRRVRLFVKAAEDEHQTDRLSAFGNRAPSAESLLSFLDSGCRLLKESSRGAFPANRRGGRGGTGEIVVGLPM